MILQIVKNTIKDGCEKEYIAGAKALSADQKLVPGCLTAGVYKTGKENEIVIMTGWESTEAMNSEAAGQAFLKNKADLKPYFLANTTEILESV